MKVFIVSIYAFPYIGFLIPVIVILSYLLVKKSTNALRETALLINKTRSPLLSYFEETITGSTTIRAFDK
jgi:hypothetical protein